MMQQLLTHGGISAMTWRENDAILNASPGTPISPQFGERSAPDCCKLTNRPADGRDFGGAIPLGACDTTPTSFDEIDVLSSTVLRSKPMSSRGGRRRSECGP